MKPEYIVGIGASAGGLEALVQFFSEMPSNSGLGFVVIQHLSPDFKSVMDELLSRHTEMPVHFAEDGMEIEANSVYLIPSKTEMAISERCLFLKDKDKSRSFSLPIDVFFASMAKDLGSKGIAIVLSGTGSDGSRGIVEVHGAGGLVISQDEGSAKFNGMAHGARDTGLVDYVLAPMKMSEALLKHIGHPLPSEGGGDLVLGMGAKPQMDQHLVIFERLRSAFKTDFSYYKPTTVNRRIERRMAFHKVDTLEQYVKIMDTKPKEVHDLYQDLLIGVTKFFRDVDAFALLEEDVIPSLIDLKKDGEQIRVWIPACASGEEAYSIAILFHEALDRSDKKLDIKIFATDLHADSVATAAAGIYPNTSLELISKARLARYFNVHGDAYRVDGDLRKMIVFAEQDLLKDPPFTKMDLVSCRNLLIYFQPVAQKKVLSLFLFALNVNGALFLGPSESLGGLENEFDTMSRTWNLFRKRKDSRMVPLINLPDQASLINRSEDLRDQAGSLFGVAHEREGEVRSAFDPDGESLSRIADLENELQITRENMQATIEDLESANKELRLKNEELQTTNEELFTVNAEYESKNRELISLNEGINNLLSSTEIGTVFVESNLRIRKFTPAAHAILNLLPTDIGRPIDHISHNLVGYDSLVEDTKTVIEEGKSLEKEAWMAGGVLLLVRILPFKTGNEEVTGAVIALIDITELKRAEIQYLESQRRLQLVLEAADFGVWSIDLETGAFECDSRVERFFGLVGCSVEERDAFLREIDFTKERFLAREWPGKDSQDAADQASWSFSLSSGELRYVSTRALVYRGVKGEVERVSGVMWDETDTKQREQQVLQKNRDLETLLYVVSHDLREPLRAIRSFSVLLSDRCGDQLKGKGADFLSRIEGSAKRMTILLDDVLSLSRINKMDATMERVPGAELIDAVLRELDTRIEETGAEIVVSNDLPELQVNFTYAKQAMSNLIGNALKFVKAGEVPKIDISPYMAPGSQQVGIEIRDRGPGIPEESLERVFKLFQRAVGRDIEGTGAGLAIVKQIARKHGGDVWYEPRRGGGAKFTITFANNR